MSTKPISVHHIGSFGPRGQMFASAYTNYEVSWDDGVNWSSVALGVPQPGEWVRNPVAPTGQDGWRWCRRCGCLHFPSTGTANRCWAGGRHDASDSDNYTVVLGGAGQPDWRWCSRCGGLFWTGSASRCPAGSGHDATGSGHYTLVFGGVGHQKSWRWCRKCSSMFFPGDADRCPAGDRHDPTGSADYTILSDDGAPSPFGQSGWRRCENCAGMY